MKIVRGFMLVGCHCVSLLSLGAEPVWEWVQTAGGAAGDFGTGVAVDSSGGIYFSGSIMGSGKVGEQTVASPSIFWCSITTTGRVSRVNTAIVGPSGHSSSSLAVAPDGHLITHGVFNDRLALGQGHNVGFLQPGAFLSAMTPTLDVVWSKAYEVDPIYSPPALSPTGDILVAASFTTITVDDVSIGSSGQTDVFALRTQGDGSRKFMQSGGGSSWDYASAAAFDPDGNAYIGGGSSSSLLSFGATIATNNPHGGSFGFIVKLDNRGVAQWSRSFGTNGQSAVFSIAAASNRDIVVGGLLNNEVSAYIGPQPRTISVFERIASSGNTVWSRKIQGLKVQDLKIDPAGNIFMLGVFVGTVEIDGRLFVSKGETDVFVAKFDENGALIWAKTAGGIFDDGAGQVAGQLALGPIGTVFIAATIGGTAQFDSIVVNGKGASDAVVAKLVDPTESPLPRFTTQPQSTIASGGMNIELTAAAVGDLPLTYQWWFNGAPLVGQASPSLILTNVRSGDAGSYFVVAKNRDGETQSQIANISYTDAASLQLSLHPSLTIFGTPGQNYRIEYAVETRSPAAWTPITTISLPAVPYVWQDTNAAIGDRRFYRVLLQP